MSSQHTPHYRRQFFNFAACLVASFATAAFTPGGNSNPTLEINLASEMPPALGPLELALGKIDQARNVQTLLSLDNNGDNRGCSDCLTAVRSNRHMTCSDKNDYLEGQLRTMSESSTLLGSMIKQRSHKNTIIKTECLEMGMTQKFNENSRSFKGCDINGKLSTKYRPCISENYFRVIENSFDLVSSCMLGTISPGEDVAEQKKDVRAAYAMINIESGFHMNAMSGTGAGGIGQFTGSAITDVNRNEISSVRFHLESSNDPRCVQMSHEMLNSREPMRDEAQNSCDRIALNRGNPMKNMIYTYAYLKRAKKNMDRLIFNSKGYDQFSQLPPAELNKIKRALMIWSHNTGPSGASSPVRTLLNSFYRNRQVTNADEFINKMQSYMSNFPASANSSSSRRKETSRYFPEITKTLIQIENNVGGGTCVN